MRKEKVALSKAQIELLEYCKIPEELQRFLGQELGPHGMPKDRAAPDFFYILCNLLKIYEVRLENLRYRLGSKINIDGKQPIIAEPSPEITLLEDEIKTAWTRASSLWNATDKLVRNPEVFGVALELSHVEYALEKGNLPVVEMIRFARPDFFEIMPTTYQTKLACAIFGGIGGGLLGIPGGMMGGAKQKEQLSNRIRPFAMVFYAIVGMFSGCAMGGITGGWMGYQTGNLSAALKLAFDAACLNPFHEPVGSKYQRAVQLRREQLLFKLAKDYANLKRSTAPGTQGLNQKEIDPFH